MVPETLVQAQSREFEIRADANYFRSFSFQDELLDALENVENFEIANSCESGQFSWAIDMIQSRVFRFEVQVKENVDPGKPHTESLRVLAPMFDFFNHSPTASSNLSLNYESQRIQLRVGRYMAGEQVLISYGDKTSDDLALFYGFVPFEHNPFAAAELRGFVSGGQLAHLEACSVPFESHKFATLASKLAAAADAKLVLPFHDAARSYLGLLVKVSVAVTSALDEIGRKRDLSDALKTKEIPQPLLILQPSSGASVASRAALFLADRMTSELAIFPTTAEEDEVMLQTLPPQDSETKMLVRLRLEKKKVLASFRVLFIALSSELEFTADGGDPAAFLEERVRSRLPS
jgi:hypothetical protein